MYSFLRSCSFSPFSVKPSQNSISESNYFLPLSLHASIRLSQDFEKGNIDSDYNLAVIYFQYLFPSLSGKFTLYLQHRFKEAKETRHQTCLRSQSTFGLKGKFCLYFLNVLNLVHQNEQFPINDLVSYFHHRPVFPHIVTKQIIIR